MPPLALLLCEPEDEPPLSVLPCSLLLSVDSAVDSAGAGVAVGAGVTVGAGVEVGVSAAELAASLWLVDDVSAVSALDLEPQAVALNATIAAMATATAFFLVIGCFFLIFDSPYEFLILPYTTIYSI